jgi:hypothetical protein
VPYLHALFCLIFTGVVVCAFNPILNSPNSAWAFWAPVGVLIASLTVTYKTQPKNGKGAL